MAALEEGVESIEIEEEEEEGVDMKGQVAIYVVDGCPFCAAAKTMLCDLRLELVVVNVDRHHELKQKLFDGTERCTVPQIFFNGEFVGGFDDLKKCQESGRLDRLVKMVQREPHTAAWPPVPEDSDSACRERDADDILNSISFVCEPDPLLPLVQAIRGTNGVCIKSRRYRLRTYKTCFVGRELVDWLVASGKAADREEALQIGAALHESNFFHHVCRDHPFRDGYFFYRFLQDEKCKCLNCSQVVSDCDPTSPGFVAESLRAVIRRMFAKFLSPSGRSVDYTGFRESPLYDEYELATAMLHRLKLEELQSPAEKLAFWINIYNALVIHSTAAHGPPRSFMGRYQFFSKCGYRIGGFFFTLNDIEHGILRANRRAPASLRSQFSSSDHRAKYCATTCDPRVHFALVCGARSCPAVSCYRPDNLEHALDVATRAFLEDDDNYTLTERKGQPHVILSMIFKWYRTDFASSDASLLNWIAVHLPPTERNRLQATLVDAKRTPKISYNPYDWNSNQEESVN